MRACKGEFAPHQIQVAPEQQSWVSWGAAVEVPRTGGVP